ncbi:hypothetical protein [Winogradskyella vidalii]|uniref:hypothetical protein n=1 Tax=Winogradskyella vidalii TaxID=2615024 RepID=UPI0037446173
MFHNSQRTCKKELNSKSDFYNCSKFELIEYCKENDLLTHGSKKKIRERIDFFLNRKSKKSSDFSLKNKRRIIKKII